MSKNKIKNHSMKIVSNILVISLILFIILITNKPSLCDDGPAADQKYGWNFINFSDTLLNWDIYCHSFFGVNSDESSAWMTSVFDKAFYELAFKTTLPAGHVSGVNIVGGGNCFGLSLLSLMMNKYGGYYGFCTPPVQYSSAVNSFGHPQYPGLKRVINIMHGHQLGLSALQTFLDQLKSGHSTDASYGVTLATQAIGKEGACLVSINRGVLTNDGHVLIVYKVSDYGGGNFKIWIVDPNRIWRLDSNYYKVDSNYIDVHGSQWSFLMDSKLSAWPCANDAVPMSPITTGTLVIFPVSIVGPTQRTPSSMGVSVLGILAQICIWGNSQSYDFEENKQNDHKIYPTALEIQKPIFKISSGVNTYLEYGEISKHLQLFKFKNDPN